MAPCLFLSLLASLLFVIAQGRVQQVIPKFLRPCYKEEFMENVPNPPFTIPVLVELIRKLEAEKENTLNMRILTTSMLHTVSLNGIVETESANPEFVLPYQVKGEHFYKYSLLVDYFTTGERELFPSDSIPTPELCLLHQFVSNTLRSKMRGDESEVCPQSRPIPNEGQHVISSPQVSNCPVELGVVRTKWGSISPFHIVATIASALQETRESYHTIRSHISANIPLRKPVNKDINNMQKQINNATKKAFDSVEISNIWLSSITGDLAEVVINQMDNTPIIATTSFWNDTLYPRRLYLSERQWDMTEAELLGGLDGAILSTNIKEWINKLPTTKLSQIIDMYYSDRGIGFDTSIKACNRHSKLHELFQYIDLYEQVTSVANLLQRVGKYRWAVTEEGIEMFTNNVLEEYHKVLARTAQANDNCDAQISLNGPMELIVVLDGTWQQYEAERIIAYFTEEADLSSCGNAIGVINGQTGEWMTNVTTDVFQFFTDLQLSKDKWPTSLVLSSALKTITFHYENERNCSERPRKIRPTGKVVVILSHSARMSDEDNKKSRESIQALRYSYPNIRFVYATKPNNKVTFETLLNENDAIVSSDNDDELVLRTVKQIQNTSSSIVDPYCNQPALFEDYLTPENTRIYEISKSYLIEEGDVTVKFHGYHYSERVVICASTLEVNICKEITVQEDEVSFRARDLCMGSACNVIFKATAVDSQFKCAEDDCRYPDQVRIDISSHYSSTASTFLIPTIPILFLFIHLFNIY